MGFLEGFAEGFTPAYLQSVKADQEKEQTLLASGLADFKARQKAFNEAKAEDAQRIRTAASVASEFGFGQDMQSYIYQRLGNGETINQIRQDLETGKFSTPDGKPITRAGMQPGTVEQQTSDAGLAPTTPAPMDAVGPGVKPKTLSYADAAPTSQYGVKRPTGNHSGIDFAMAKSTPVGVLRDGVARVASDPVSGNYVRVEHPDGHVSSYAHLDGFNVKDGQEVKAGDVIGFSGNTGRVRGANGGYHLHLGVRDPEGNRIDPRPFIQESMKMLASNQQTTAPQNTATGPSEEFNTAFADIPAPADLPSEGATETSGELPPVSRDIVVEGKAQEAPVAQETAAPPKKKGDGFGYDARGRAQRSLIDAAGGMEVYSQILGGYKPDPVQSNVRFQPGTKSGNFTSEFQLRMAIDDARERGDTATANALQKRLDGFKTDTMEAKSWENAQPVTIVIPDGKGGASFKSGFRISGPDGIRLVDSQSKPITDPNARPAMGDEVKDAREISRAAEASIARYRDKAVAMASLLPVATDMLDIVRFDGRVLDPVAGATATVSGAVRSATNALNILNNMISANSGKPLSMLDAEKGLRSSGILRGNETLEQAAKRSFTLGKDAESLAANTRLFQAKLAYSVYMFAGTAGQSGQGLSNNDVTQWTRIVSSGSSNPQVFTKNLLGLVKGGIQSVNMEAKALNDPRSGEVATFRSIYGWNAHPRVSGLDSLVQQQGGDVLRAYTRITGVGTPKGQGGSGGNKPAQQNQSAVPNMIRNGKLYRPIVDPKTGRAATSPDGKIIYRGSDGKPYVF